MNYKLLLLMLFIFSNACGFTRAESIDSSTVASNLYKTDNAFLPLIVNGKPTNIQNHPYHVSIQEKRRIYDGRDRFHFCSGSIINPVSILTAAHCVNKYKLHHDNIVIQAGSTMIFDAWAVVNTISEIIIHEQFDYNTALNDIAIIKVNNKFKFGLYINAIEIPRTSDILSENEIVTITGWGTYSVWEPISSKLLKASMKIYDGENCQKKYKKIDFQSVNPKKQICIVGDHKSPCTGDSGGPLVVNNTLYGISSFGSKYCSVHFTAILPAVYTRVSSYVNWINRFVD